MVSWDRSASTSRSSISQTKKIVHNMQGHLDLSPRCRQTVQPLVIDISFGIPISISLLRVTSTIGRVTTNHVYRYLNLLRRVASRNTLWPSKATNSLNPLMFPTHRRLLNHSHLIQPLSLTMNHHTLGDLYVLYSHLCQNPTRKYFQKSSTLMGTNHVRFWHA